jgi:hypothetical protein
MSRRGECLARYAHVPVALLPEDLFTNRASARNAAREMIMDRGDSRRFRFCGGRIVTDDKHGAE